MQYHTCTYLENQLCNDLFKHILVIQDIERDNIFFPKPPKLNDFNTKQILSKNLNNLRSIDVTKVREESEKYVKKLCNVFLILDV